ncbi:MAG: hypothetical protein F6K10_03290 [Moorea sp. SIO2B7]|nr:hypothetical protein [Moorena sp. SIO2B7]
MINIKIVKSYFFLFVTVTFVFLGVRELSLLASTDNVIKKTSNGTQFVRTPEEAFLNLPDYPFKPNYVVIDGLRITTAIITLPRAK